MKVVSIDIVYHLEDESGKEEEVKASVNKNTAWSQWGAETKIMGKCVDLTQKIQEALLDE